MDVNEEEDEDKMKAGNNIVVLDNKVFGLEEGI